MFFFALSDGRDCVAGLGVLASDVVDPVDDFCSSKNPYKGTNEE